MDADRVERLLDELGHEWDVRHAVTVGAASEVEHLLVGPAGVIALTTLHHPGERVWIDDDRLRVGIWNTPLIGTAAAGAADAAHRLSTRLGFPVAVHSVVVTEGETALRDVRALRAGVARQPAVVSSKQLVAWIRALPRHDSLAEVGLLRLAAEEAATWNRDGSDLGETALVGDQFERLAEAAGLVPSPDADSATGDLPQHADRAVREVIPGEATGFVDRLAVVGALVLGPAAIIGCLAALSFLGSILP